MDNQSSSSIENDQPRYSDEYNYAMAVLAGNIPSMAKGAKGYNISLARDDKSDAVQISLDIDESLKADDKKLSEEAISQFVEFARHCELWGVHVSDNGCMTFANAGSLSNLIAMYIEDNPDDLDAETLNKIDREFGDVLISHGPNTEEIAHTSPTIQDAYRNPICAHALIDGMLAIRKYYNSDENLAFYYTERPNSNRIEIRFVCDSVEAEDEISQKDIGILTAMYESMDVLASELPVRIGMNDDNTGFTIEVDGYLDLLSFVRECYLNNDIGGVEDAYYSYKTDIVMTGRYDADNVIIGKDSNGKEHTADLRQYGHVVNEARRHFGRECLEVGLDLIEQNGDYILQYVPMVPFTHQDQVKRAMAIAIESHGMSLEYVEARVVQGLGMQPDRTQRALRIH